MHTFEPQRHLLWENSYDNDRLRLVSLICMHRGHWLGRQLDKDACRSSTIGIRGRWKPYTIEIATQDRPSSRVSYFGAEEELTVPEEKPEPNCQHWRQVL